MNAYHGDTPLTRFLAEQTLGQLREMKSAVRSEIEAARSRVSELEADLARIDAAISEKGGGRSRMNQAAIAGNKSRSASKEQISLRQAILSLMRDQPATVWTTQDMLDELTVRQHAPGGKTPLNTIGSRMLELAKDGKITRRGRGEYIVATLSGNGFAPQHEVGDSD